jgi:hypothetical protein
MKKLGLFLLLFIVTSVAMSYNDPAKWTTHFSYSNTDYVCLTENKVFALANNHLYSISKEDGVLDTYTKLDGFSDNEITNIGYNKDVKSLIIVYSNSNIDILESNGTIFNIPDLYQKQMSVNKTVYQITMDKEYAYLSTGFGIVVVNLKKKEIANTYIIGPDATKVPVYGIAIDDEYIYALSSQYIFKAQKENTNLLDYNYWQEDKIKLKTKDACKKLFKFASSLFTIKRDSIVSQYTENTWEDFYTAPKLANISLTEDLMLISAGENGIVSYDKKLSETNHISNYAIHCAYDKKQDTFWIASGEKGCSKLNNKNERYQNIGDISDINIKIGNVNFIYKLKNDKNHK